MNGSVHPCSLGERWLDCILIHCSGVVGGLPPHREREAEIALEAHLAAYPAAARRNVWFDAEAGSCFSAAQLRGGPCGKDYNFLAEPEHFLDGLWGRRYVEGSIGCNKTFLAYAVRCEADYVLGHPPTFGAFRGKRIVLVLGGPTAARTRWQAVDCDYRWSCNKFYLHPRLRQSKLALIALAPDVPLDDNPALHAYLVDHETKVVFEIERGGPVGSWHSVNAFVGKYGARCGFFHPRYQSALGLGSRMILLAIFLGAKEIAFVGFDGMTANGPLHSFEPDKPNPQWYERFGPGLQRRQYVIFWEYVLSLQASYGFRLLNLGEVSRVNLSRSISKRYFPLTGAMKRQLKLS